MSDLISRQAAIEAVEYITSSMSVCVNTDECHGMKRMQRQAVIELANLPSAQPERKKGKWVFEDGKPVNRTLEMCEIAICNQCGETAPGYPFWECDLELTYFCPHCGAMMDGERREEDAEA